MHCSVGSRSFKRADRMLASLFADGGASVEHLHEGLFGWCNDDRPSVNAWGATRQMHPLTSQGGLKQLACAIEGAQALSPRTRPISPRRPMNLPPAATTRKANDSTTRTLLHAFRIVFTPTHLRRTLAIALAVGSWLTLVNQGDVILHSGWSQLLVMKLALNYLTPFVVANLGLLSRTKAPVHDALYKSRGDTNLHAPHS